MTTDKAAAFNEAIQTVLELADSELCSLYAVARRDGDEELEVQADAAAKALALAEPLLKAAPKLLASLKGILSEAEAISHHTPHLGADFWAEARAAVAAAESEAA